MITYEIILDLFNNHCCYGYDRNVYMAYLDR